ncbi:hypothetical protein [Bailinhaonella thermotolerans]|uniref:Uncharacterized protein n=1 Tax=Bailinhaonella thermotolerans TaxID=1070861 RepID=A0A3A4A8S3_9ACTN|nr:hypothetical protein [Bailinhaonella thermotolerans]RJL24481.1 hypothetical protein D5H75_29630 [Bailinhaonella thermotolerans]
MSADPGATASGGRRNPYSDLTLPGLLGEPPAAPLSLSGDPTRAARLLNQIARGTDTPRETRHLIGTGRITAATLDECRAQGRDSDLLLSVLARARRAQRLDEGDVQWLLAVLEHPGPAPTDSPVSDMSGLSSRAARSEPGQGEYGGRAVAWVRLKPGQPPDKQIEELDYYLLPAGADHVREELVLIAMEVGWRLRLPVERQVLLLLGPHADACLGGDLAELVVRAAVDGVHLNVLSVPWRSDCREWQAVRADALRGSGPVVSAAAGHETSVDPLLRALRSQAGRLVAPLAQPPDGRWTMEWILERLGEVDLFPDDREPGGAHPAAGEPSPEPPDTDAAPAVLPILLPSTGPPAPAGRRREIFEVFLFKSGKASGYDVLKPTGRRCDHNAWQRMGPSRPVQKWKGVQRYLAKLRPPGTLEQARWCTYSACGLVWVQYAVDSAPEDGAPPGPGDPALDDDPPGTPVRQERSPPGPNPGSPDVVRRGSARRRKPGKGHAAYAEETGGTPRREGGNAVRLDGSAVRREPDPPDHPSRRPPRDRDRPSPRESPPFGMYRLRPL